MLGQLDIQNISYKSGRDFLCADFSQGAILLDLIEGLAGLDVLRTLGTKGCTQPVILVIENGDVRSVVSAMKAGAIDVLERPYSDHDLLTALDDCFDVIADRGESQAALASATKRVSSLSPRQQQILQGMVAGMTNKAMARLFHLSPRTVEMHRADTFNRLGASNVADAIRIANAAAVPQLVSILAHDQL